MFLTDQTNERQLFAFTVRDLVADDSDVWLYMDLFDSLNLEAFDWSYSNEGQHPIDPKLILRTIFYGLTHGVVSGHKLETVCRNDNRFIVLSGDRRPDRRTFDRFIRRHHERIESLFVDSVRLAQAMGLVELGRVALDGSRFKGNTSRHRAMSYEKMERAIGHIKAELASLRASLAEVNAGETALDDRLSKDLASKEKRLARIKAAKEQIEKEHAAKSKGRKSAGIKPGTRKSLNDPEALSLDSRGRTFIYGYNAQAAVDSKSQIVVAADFHDKAADYQALPSLLSQIEESCGQQAAEVLADLGYKSGDNILEIEQRGALPFVAVTSKDGAEADIEFYEQITPLGEPHEYQCLAGKRLTLNHRGADGSTEFYFSPTFCRDCPFANTCKVKGRRTVGVPSEEKRKAQVRLLQRSRTKGFKETYKYRKAIVEPVFGNIKNKGMRIYVVGKTKVRTWWKMACTAHNFEKIIGAMTSPPDQTLAAL